MLKSNSNILYYRFFLLFLQAKRNIMSRRRFKNFIKKRFLDVFYSDDYMKVLYSTFGGSMSLINGTDKYLAIKVKHNDGKSYRLFYMIDSLENSESVKCLRLLKIYYDEEMAMKNKNLMTMPVATINDFLWNLTDEGHEAMCSMLTSYVHTSHRICNSDGSIYQPSFPNKKVIDFQHYEDKELFGYAHKTNRLLLIFDDNTEYEVSLYKFKRYAKNLEKK